MLSGNGPEDKGATKERLPPVSNRSGKNAANGLPWLDPDASKVHALGK
jgi:hypothetical protein